MDVKEAIQKRRSIRRFKPDPVSDDLIQQLLESARLAPSGSNTQPWRFIVVKDAESRQKLQAASYNQRHVGQAPVIIACCADIKAFAEIPKNIEIVALLPIGYPAEEPPKRPRFDLEKIVYYEKYGAS